MSKLSEQYPQLKPFNKAAAKKRDIRLGVTVITNRGVGIVTWRKGEDIEVAVRPDREGEIMPCYRYNYTVDDVDISAEEVSSDDRLYNGAWYWIMNNAIGGNQHFEAVKHRAIFDEWEPRIPGKRTDRVVSMGTWGSTKYRRYTGVNKQGKPFDFELCLSPSLAIPYGDRIMYALGASDGYITDINGHGWIYRRKITYDDVNYGIAKYAGPQEEAL